MFVYLSALSNEQLGQLEDGNTIFWQGKWHFVEWLASDLIKIID